MAADPDAAWRYAMRYLHRATPGGPFAWRAGGLDAVASMLGAALAVPTAPAASDAVGGLLRLASALRRRLASAPAADALIAVLERTPGAVALARKHFGAGRREDARRRFQDATGTRPIARAPSIADARTPGGGTPLRNLIDPLERERRRVPSSKK